MVMYAHWSTNVPQSSLCQDNRNFARTSGWLERRRSTGSIGEWSETAFFPIGTWDEHHIWNSTRTLKIGNMQWIDEEEDKRNNYSVTNITNNSFKRIHLYLGKYNLSLSPYLNVQDERSSKSPWKNYPPMAFLIFTKNILRSFCQIASLHET